MSMEVAISEVIRTAFGPVADLLERHPELVFGEPTPTPLTFADSLSVDLGGGASLTERVLVGIGDAERGDGSVQFRVSICAAEHDHRFPTFNGVLKVSDWEDVCDLDLTGVYVVPLGPLGRAADLLVGHRAAHASMHGFVTALAARVERAVGEEVDVEPPPVEHPEHFIA